MGNAVICWTLISHSLITAYQAEATPWRIKSIIRDVLITLRIDAFVDDTNMIHGDNGDTDIREILQVVQSNFCLWQGLLHASGGMLTPTQVQLDTIRLALQQLGTRTPQTITRSPTNTTPRNRPRRQ